MSEVIKDLYEVIQDRKSNPMEGSYTNYLFEKGLDKILKKVGEETAEVLISSKNDDNSEVVYEICDLAYHVLVLMAEKGISLEEITAELQKRSEKIGNKKVQKIVDKNS